MNYHKLVEITNLLLSTYTEIHINYLVSESTQKLINLKQKFLHSDVVGAGQQFNYNQLATSSVQSPSTKRRITDKLCSSAQTDSQ